MLWICEFTLTLYKINLRQISSSQNNFEIRFNQHTTSKENILRVQLTRQAQLGHSLQNHEPTPLLFTLAPQLRRQKLTTQVFPNEVTWQCCFGIAAIFGFAAYDVTWMGIRKYAVVALCQREFWCKYCVVALCITTKVIFVVT